jgi:hypothetical protein
MVRCTIAEGSQRAFAGITTLPDDVGRAVESESRGLK